MKKNLILAATAASTLVVVGLTACGSTSTPEAEPLPDVFPAERACADIPRPADPHGLIGNNWFNDDACNIFNMNRPGAGVDADQAAKIVYDARMKLMMGKRDISMLARQGNAQISTPSGVEADFAGLIAQRYSSIKDEMDASRDALGGHAPEGYRIFILKGEGR